MISVSRMALKSRIHPPCLQVSSPCRVWAPNESPQRLLPPVLHMMGTIPTPLGPVPCKLALRVLELAWRTPHGLGPRAQEAIPSTTEACSTTTTGPVPCSHPWAWLSTGWQQCLPSLQLPRAVQALTQGLVSRRWRPCAYQPPAICGK